jgi:hypothetical protein
MLSSLPKLADRAFILGAFLPALLFAVVGLVLFNDQDFANKWIDALTAKDAMTTKELGQAAYMLLAVWALGVLTLIFNHPLYRFLEGYTFPRWLAVPLKNRNRRRLRDSLLEIRRLHDKWAEQQDAFTAEERDRYRTLRLELVESMPSRESDVLPTRFGNAIKAFEVYPRDIYGADGIVIWLRLAAVIPKPFLDQIQDVRSQIDFLINCCFFSTMIALLGVGRAVYSGGWHDIDLHTVAGFYAFISSIKKYWLLWAAGGAIAAHVFYRLAVTRVPAWGSAVMSAFDCYLPALATQLGFELPKEEAKRQEFWTTLSLQLINRREPDGTSPFQVGEWTQVATGRAEAAKKTHDPGDDDERDESQEGGSESGAKETTTTVYLSLHRGTD